MVHRLLTPQAIRDKIKQKLSHRSSSFAKYYAFRIINKKTW